MRKLKLFSLALMALFSTSLWANYDVPAYGTFTLLDGGKVNNGKTFNLVGTGVYAFRNSSNYSWDATYGLKIQGTDGGVIFYIDTPRWIKVTINHTESKNAHDVTVKIINITESVYKEFDDNKAETTGSNRKFTNDISTTADSTFTISVTATTAEFTGTKKLAAGYYAIIATGGKSNTWFKAIDFLPELTWNFDGGVTSATAGTDYTAGGPVGVGTALTYPANNTMSKDGYTFTGWSSSASTMPASNLTISAQWVSAGGTTHEITYSNTKNATATSTLPEIYYEGYGIASFPDLNDVKDFHFTGWSPASISAEATTDQEIAAQWVAAYNVTFNKGAASGTAPASFQKWEDAEFNLPGQGDMVAPDGREFDGWITGGTKYAAGATYTMTNAAVEFTATWKNIPQTIFHYQWTGSGTKPAIDDVLDGTGGSITVERKDGSSKTLSDNESASFVASVPADMRFSGETSKGLKMGTNDVWFHVALTSGKFQAGDIIKICGYSPCIISSSNTNSAGDGDIIDSLATGTNKDNYNVSSCVYPSIASSDLYIRRLNSTVNFGFAAIKVLRPVYDIVVDENIEDGSVVASVGGVASATANYNQTVTLTVTPDDGYKIASVTLDGEPLTPVESVYSFTMPLKDVAVSATFSVTTSLDNTADEAKAVKRLENGMLVIEKNGVRYNAMGQAIH